MSKDNQLAVAETPFVKASTQLSTMLGIETGMMIDTLKAQCFKGLRPDQVSDMQLAAFVAVAVASRLNPLEPGMLYAYPERNGGITPIIGPDGVFKKLDEHVSQGKLGGYECTVYPEDAAEAPTHASAVIYRKDAPDHPAKYTAHMAEWRVESNSNWKVKPRHMLWLRALKQCARQVIHGLPADADEHKLAEMLNVTESNSPASEVKRDAPPERAPSGVAASKAKKKDEKIVDGELVPNAEKPKEPVTALADKETHDFVCRVVSFATDIIKTKDGPFPSVKAIVEGEFAGTVYHLGGAEEASPGNLIPHPAWLEKKPVKLTLTGKAVAPKKNEDGTTTPRPCAIMCSAIEPVTPTAPAEQGTSEVE